MEPDPPVCEVWSMITVASPPPTTDWLPAPIIVSAALPDGTVQEIEVVHVQVPAGMFTVVVEAAT